MPGIKIVMMDAGQKILSWKWGPVELNDNGQVQWDNWDECWQQAVESSGYNVNQALSQQVMGTTSNGIHGIQWRRWSIYFL